MKAIIQRHLPLDVKYTLIGKKYIPLVDSCGICCDNCSHLLANIATVKSVNGTFSIGFDCLETFLINNQLLDGKSIEEYQHFKSHLSQMLKFANELKDTIYEHNRTRVTKITGLEVHISDFKSWAEYCNFEKNGYLTFYYILEGGKKCNDCRRIKNSTNTSDLIELLKTVLKIDLTTI